MIALLRRWMDEIVTGSFLILLLILAHQRGSTIIVATHDAGLAARAPQRLRMRDGKLVDVPAAVS